MHDISHRRPMCVSLCAVWVQSGCRWQMQMGVPRCTWWGRGTGRGYESKWLCPVCACTCYMPPLLSSALGSLYAFLP